jgi:type VI secretion system protein ImpK
MPARGGLNPLENAAAALLTLMVRLKNLPAHPDPDGLRQQVIEEIKIFETKARSLGVNQETLVAARYVLCTAVDELLLNTPWGSTSVWRQQSLLITFHKEAWGGEKFFLLLDKLVKDPSGNRDLLELMYLCLALGFQGRYRVLDGGYTRLEELRERLYHTLRAQHGDFERELSPHWQGIVDKRNPLIRHVPLWVVSALACALLVAIYIGFSLSLNRASDPVFAALLALDKDISTPLAPPPPIAKPTPATAGLRGFLAPEIREGLVEVKESADRTTVLIRGDGLFDSASAAVRQTYYPLLTRIADALKVESGQVLVTGHTDNIPIRTLRFPSNWHLSQQRAEAVVKLLAAATGSPGRFRAEGRADSEPLAANDSAANRALNRRVEITLLARVGRP